MWLLGNKQVLGWWVGLANQLLWAWFIVVFGAWGLAPLTLTLSVTYVRNIRKWQSEEHEEAS